MSKNNILRDRISKSGKSFAEIAVAIKAPSGSLKGWVNDDKMPLDKLKLLAKELGTSAEELQKAGVTLPRPRNVGGIVHGDLLPVLKVIMESGVTSLTYAHLKKLLDFRQQLGKEMSPEFVKEFLNHLT